MGFKVGDKVKILNTEFGNQGKIGIIENISGTTMIYFVKLDGSCNSQWSDASDLELVIEEVKVVAKVGDKVQINELGLYFGSCGIVTDNQRVGIYSHKVIFEDGDRSVFTEKDLIVLSTEEEKVMKFKVGDKVKVKDSWFGHDGQVGVVLDTANYGPFNYNIKFDTEGDNERRDENFKEDSLELVTEEEETSMKFKVGDKVKVSNSWFGFTDEVGVIASVEDQEPEFKYTVKFNVEDGETKEESFREEELELVTQSFTKSDLKTGMGVVLRNGRKGHILVDTGCVDVIRFLENGNYSCTDDFSDDLTSNYNEEHDIMEVYFTEYQFKLLTDQVFDQDCVFKREEPKPEPKPEPEPTKMTMKEINEHFGKPIEIVE